MRFVPTTTMVCIPLNSRPRLFPHSWWYLAFSAGHDFAGSGDKLQPTNPRRQLEQSLRRPGADDTQMIVLW